MKWNEPLAVRQAEYARNPRLRYQRNVFRSIDAGLPVLVVGVVGFAMASERHPSDWLWLVGLGGGLFLFNWWLFGFRPFVVHVTTQMIRISSSGEFRTWFYRDIDHCEIVTRRVGGNDLAVLVVETKSGDRPILGIAPDVSLRELRATLEGRGVVVTPAISAIA